MDEDDKNGDEAPADNTTEVRRVTLPITLWHRIDNAAYWEGAGTASNLIRTAVRQWISQREDLRIDGSYPNAPDVKRRGPAKRKA